MSHCYRSVVGSLTVLVLSHCPRQLCFPVRAATVATAGRSYKSSHKASVSYLPHYQVTDKVSNLTVNKAERLSPKEPDGFLRKRWQKRAIKKYRNSGLTFVSSKDTWARKYYTKKKKMCLLFFLFIWTVSVLCWRWVIKIIKTAVVCVLFVNLFYNFSHTFWLKILTKSPNNIDIERPVIVSYS